MRAEDLPEKVELHMWPFTIHQWRSWLHLWEKCGYLNATETRTVLPTTERIKRLRSPGLRARVTGPQNTTWLGHRNFHSAKSTDKIDSSGRIEKPILPQNDDYPLLCDFLRSYPFPHCQTMTCWSGCFVVDTCLWSMKRESLGCSFFNPFLIIPVGTAVEKKTIRLSWESKEPNAVGKKWHFTTNPDLGQRRPSANNLDMMGPGNNLNHNAFEFMAGQR